MSERLFLYRQLTNRLSVMTLIDINLIVFTCVYFFKKIQAHRIQGLTFAAETDKGDIEVKAVYADSSKVMTSSGQVHLGSCHREASVCVKETGRVHIGRWIVARVRPIFSGFLHQKTDFIIIISPP